MLKRNACLLFIALSSYAASPQEKMSKDAIIAASGESRVRVIVQWKGTPDETKHQKVLSRGGSLKSIHASIKAAVYEMPGSEVADLANDPDVAYISPDRPVGGSLDLTAAAVNATYAWSKNFDGTGVTVAVIDSGMNSSPDLTLNNQVIYNQDFTGEVTPNANLTDTHNAPDLYGHGQHVAGIIASSGKTSSCGNCTRLLKGISPGVRLVNLRVLNESGVGTDSMVIAAIEKAIILKSQYNIRVINISLGRPVYESYTQDPLCQAVEQAWKAGIAVVVAAGNNGRDNTYGNEGYGTINAPGNDPYVITVGAMKTEGTPMRTDDLIASYSSKGPTPIDFVVKPDLVAPGNQVVSLLAGSNAQLVVQNPANNVPVSNYRSSNNTKPSNVYFTLSGTSMATPVVTAAVADLIEANPALTPDQIKALLMKTAYKTFPTSSTAYDLTTGQAYVSYYDIFTVGAGYLDLQAALQNMSTVPTEISAISPVAVYNGNTGIVNLSPASSSVWATKSMWGAQAVWSSSEVNSTAAGTTLVNASKSMWGATTDASTSTVWGQKSMWGATTDASTSAVWGQKSMWGASTTIGAAAASIAIHGEQ